MAGDRLSVKTICKLTGINEHTLRAWERRYQLVEPERLDNGRRVYSLDDLEKLKLVSKLLAQGFLIGNIAGQTPEELTQLLHDTAPSQQGSQRSDRSGTVDQQIIDAAWSNDFHLAYYLLQRERINSGLRSFLFDLMQPLLTKMELGSCTPKLSGGQSLALRAAIKAIALDLFYALNQPDRIKEFRTRSLVLANLYGSQSEIETILSGILCAINEFPLVYLGDHVSIKELTELANDTALNTVCLGKISGKSTAVTERLNELAVLLRSNCEIWLVSESNDFLELIEEAYRPRFKVFDSFQQLDYTLTSFR